MLRLLFLADAVFEDLPGGSRTAAGALARGLATRGHQVTFLVGRQTAEAAQREERDGVRVVRYPGAGRGAEFVRQGRQAAARLWAEEKFDLVHTHFAYAAVGPKSVIPPPIPRVRTFHGPWDEEGWIEETQGRLGPLRRAKALLKRQVRRAVEARDLRGSDLVLTLSDGFRRLAVERFGVPADRALTLVGGTDLTRFCPAPDRAAVRRSLDLPPDRTILLSVRRLVPRMGLERLLAAMPAVTARRPDALLLIGGQGPERARLRERIGQLGLEGHVRLLGFIPPERLASFYQTADLFVLPTLALEGFGLVTTEALACGTAVVGTPVGATPDILGALDPRLVAADVTAEALAAAILEYLGGGWAAEITPTRLHEFVRDRYTWERHVEATEAIYQNLIRSGGSAPAFAGQFASLT